MSAVVVPSPTARRIKTPSWLDVRLVLGIALVIGSVAVGTAVVAGADHSDRMLVVNRDLAAGTVLRADDVSVVSARVPDRSRYLDRHAHVVGQQLNRAVSRGELLPVAALTTAPALTTVTVTFPDGAAPSVAQGQRIEIWVSTKVCGSVVLVGEATVQDVAESGGSGFSSGGGQNVTLSLPPRLAGRVVSALALDGAAIRAGVVSGPRQADVPLPPLDGCATASP